MASSWQSRGRLTNGPSSMVPDDDLTPNNLMKERRFPNSIVGKYCPILRSSSKTTYDNSYDHKVHYLLKRFH
jgi:hypothetical protein